MQRRIFIAGLAAAVAARSGATPKGREIARLDATAAAQFAHIETESGGRLGVTAVDTGSGARVSHGGGERFALCSTFKWLLAAAVLAEVDRNVCTLGQRVSFGPADLLDVSPVTTQHVGEGGMSVEALCEAAIEVSDNTAANALLTLLGGPAALTAYLGRSGDFVTRLDRTEPSLNSNLPKDPRDTTTPNAMCGTMQRILVGDALSPQSRERLLVWLKRCETGRQRLRAGLPPAWGVGDKTGTGSNGAVNDLAITWPPGRSPLLIACYLSGSTASTDALAAVHARVGRVVAAAFS